MKTRTTTRRSGRNSGGSPKPPEKWTGDDPYKPICDKLHSLLTRKSGYYGCPNDGPLANALGVKDQGIEPWLYQLARIGEKSRRLLGRAGDDDTLLIETFNDIAGHAIVAIACILERRKKN